MNRLISTLVVGLISGALGGAAVWYGLSSGTFAGLSNPQTIGDVVQTVADRNVEETSATIDVVEAASDSVVSIVVTKEYQQVQQRGGTFGSPFFDDFFGGPQQAPQSNEEGETEQVEVGSGTGFVVSDDGIIVTNRHVVSEADASYTVVFDDGTSYEAEVVGRDVTTDLALLQIDAKDLPALELADSDKVVVGQSVIAIGNTLGEYDNTVTKGIISGLSRDLGGQYSGLIQTDAAINSGNSGGPLLNLDGQVVGINTAVDRSGEGIGFAIPINDAKAAIDSVKEHGRIIRAGLGVRYIEIDPELAELNDLPYEYGAYIRGDNLQFGVIAGSPADKAGINEGDIILEVDGTKVDQENSLSELLRGKSVGDQAVLKVYQDGEEKDITVTLEELPAENTDQKPAAQQQDQQGQQKQKPEPQQ